MEKTVIILILTSNYYLSKCALMTINRCIKYWTQHT